MKTCPLPVDHIGRKKLGMTVAGLVSYRILMMENLIYHIPSMYRKGGRCKDGFAGNNIELHNFGVSAMCLAMA